MLLRKNRDAEANGPSAPSTSWCQVPTVAPGHLVPLAGGPWFHAARGAALAEVHGPFATVRFVPSQDLDSGPDTVVAVELAGQVVGHVPQVHGPALLEVIDELAAVGEPATGRLRVDRLAGGAAPLFRLDLLVPPTAMRVDLPLIAGTARFPLAPEVLDNALVQDLRDRYPEGAVVKLAVSGTTVAAGVGFKTVGLVEPSVGSRYAPLVQELTGAGLVPTALLVLLAEDDRPCADLALMEPPPLPV